MHMGVILVPKLSYDARSVRLTARHVVDDGQ